MFILKWGLTFAPPDRRVAGISSMTERPARRKLVRQLEGLLVTSVGVILAVVVQLFRSEVDPRGVHHFSVTVAYSHPSFCVCTSSAPSVTVF